MSTQGSILSALPGLHAIVDLNGKFSDISDDFAQYIGYQNSETFLGSQPTYEGIRTPAVELSPFFRKEDKKIAHSSQSLRQIAFCHYKDGIRCLFGAKYPKFDQDGILSEISMSYMDATDTELKSYFKSLLLSGPSEQLIYYLENRFQNENLSQRESECLYYLLRGRSAGMIGEILNLSRRTIEGYIDAIKIKFNCSSKFELIEKSIDLGYLHIIPESVFLKKKL